MKYIYEIIESKNIDDLGVSHTVCGISCRKANENTVLCAVKDIFTDRKSAEQLVELLNSYELSPVHLDDIIEDSLAM